MPRDFWLEQWEINKILEFYGNHITDGYRRVAYMMLDKDIVAVSPSTVYRTLDKNDCLRRWNRKQSKKGKGFEQPLIPHEHWHIDISYINICGTFFYLCTTLDGCSRYIVHWELLESMKEEEVELVIQKALEKFPGVTPRIISDNGPQFIAKDFKEFIRLTGLTHVRTSPYYPQSNGKIERLHKTLKSECIRKKVPVSHSDARRLLEEYVLYYNTERLNSAIGYVTPRDKLIGKEKEIFQTREEKLQKARLKRALNKNLFHNNHDKNKLQKNFF